MIWVVIDQKGRMEEGGGCESRACPMSSLGPAKSFCSGWKVSEGQMSEVQLHRESLQQAGRLVSLD